MKYYRVAFFNEIGEAVSPLDIKAGTMAEAKKTYLDRVREAVGQKIVGVEIPTKEAKKREVKQMAKIKETKKTQEVKASVKENTEVKKMAKTTRTKKSEVKAMASYELNKEHNGVEIKFIEKPEVEIREALKDAGFHWNPKTEVWYAKATKETVKRANEIAKAA